MLCSIRRSVLHLVRFLEHYNITIHARTDPDIACTSAWRKQTNYCPLDSDYDRDRTGSPRRLL